MYTMQVSGTVALALYSNRKLFQAELWIHYQAKSYNLCIIFCYPISDKYFLLLFWRKKKLFYFVYFLEITISSIVLFLYKLETFHCCPIC